MKTTKIMGAVLAVFLALALFAGAGSALLAGETLFVYQEVATATDLPLGTYYLWENGQQTSTSVTAVASGANSVIKGESIKEGLYKDAGATTYFVLKYPTADISAYYTVSKGSIVGKTIAVGDTITITATTASSTAPVVAVTGLLFTTPSGGKTTYFNTVDCSALTTITRTLTAPIESGTWGVQGVFTGGAPFSVDMPLTYLEGRTVVYFDVAQSSSAIKVDKDELTRGNNFIVTITGTPGAAVTLTVDKDGLLVLGNQPGITTPAPGSGVTTAVGPSGSNVVGTIQANGVLVVEFSAPITADAQSYKITWTQKDKSVKVNVVKGVVTIKAGQESYYLGDDIKLSGTNTEGGLVYLFIKGSNVPETQLAPLAGVSVKSDDTWSRTVTLPTGLYDAGTYTFYAASALTVTGGIDKNSAYEVVAVTLKQPFLNANAASSVVAEGDDMVISGIAEAASTTGLRYYVFGTNLFDSGVISVDDDASFTKKIDTTGFSTGQYFVVIQHPMYDGKFNIAPVSGYKVSSLLVWDEYGSSIVLNTKDQVNAAGEYTLTPAQKAGTAVLPLTYTASSAYLTPLALADVGKTATAIDAGLNKVLFTVNTRQSANAAEALCQALDTQNIDDIYVKLTFQVATPTIVLSAVADQTVGSTLTVSGTTNVAAGESITVEIISTAFTAVDKSTVSSASYLVQTTKVVAGNNGVNTFEVTFDTTPLNVDTYTVSAEIPTANNLRTSTTFKVLEAKPTATATATATKTATATATATATPTKTPGFGAFLALAGLGAVAVLVLRRD